MRFENDIDSFIDTALRGEAGLVPAPRTLRDGVNRRIQYARLRDQEARRFRTAVFLFAGCTVASFIAVVGAALFAISQPASRPGLSGIEYQMARWTSIWTEIRGDAVLYGGAALVGLLLIAASLPLGKRLLNN